VLPERFSRSAVLVECTRTANGPRQRIIKHLASINEKYLDTPAHQWLFWQQVRRGLDEAGIAGEPRGRMEGKLVEVVPDPGCDYKEAQRRTLEQMQQEGRL